MASGEHFHAQLAVLFRSMGLRRGSKFPFTTLVSVVYCVSHQRLISFFCGPQAIQISHKFVDLHAEHTPYILERFKLAVSNGDPVNPPIW